MKRYNFTIIASLVILLAGSGFCFAALTQSQPAAAQDDYDAPQVIQSPTDTLFSYQGQLLDAAGNPVNHTAMPMIFKLYSVATGGSTCWTESQTVQVEDGRFHVNIGAITSIPDTCLEHDAYLELTISGETLAPRELLTSVAFAIEAESLAAGDIAIVGALDVSSTSYLNGITLDNDTDITGADMIVGYNDLQLYGDTAGGPDIYIATSGNVGIGTSNPSAKLHVNGSMEVGGSITGASNLYGNYGQQLHMPSNGNLYLNWHNGGSIAYGGGTQTVRFSVDPTGDGYFAGNLTAMDGTMVPNPNNNAASVTLNWLNNTARLRIGGDGTGASNGFDIQGPGNTSLLRVYGNGNAHVAGNLTCGGYIETNLQTLEEQAAMQIERFSEGDLMCWDAKSERLELCAQPNDTLVMAVADPNGKPIIMGAEFIHVTGSVKAGDILVTSSIPGYAMVNNNPSPGTVIGQALEDFNGESGLIKAMIRKW